MLIFVVIVYIRQIAMKMLIYSIPQQNDLKFAYQYNVSKYVYLGKPHSLYSLVIHYKCHIYVEYIQYLKQIRNRGYH